MSGMSEAWPVRVHHRREAELRFGTLGARLVPYLERLDPLADDAVAELSRFSAEERRTFVDVAVSGGDAPALPALGRLIDSVRCLPVWVDEARLARAGAVFRRAGVLGGLTLGLRSLVHGYAAPAGNKPLAFSGRLTDKADRRLAETGKFVTAVTAPGGLVPFAPGFRICLQVRLMHAEVRRLLLASGRYRTDLWSLPINQHDMLATILLFSNVFVGGLRLLGVTITDEEADDYQHLFRLVGVWMGVEPELLPATFREAERLGAFILATQGPPDADSLALVDALLSGPLRAAKTDTERRRAEVTVRVSKGLCRALVGDELADQLGLPRDRHRHLARGIRSTLRVLERLRGSFPLVDEWVMEAGARYWERSVRVGLGKEDARYELPMRLAGRSRVVPVGEES